MSELRGTNASLSLLSSQRGEHDRSKLVPKNCNQSKTLHDRWQMKNNEESYSTQYFKDGYSTEGDNEDLTFVYKKP